MPVTAYSGAASYTGNGVTTVFAYPWRVLASSDIKITVDGVTKTLTTDYSVSGVGAGGGGNVTFVSAPASGAAIVIERVRPYMRATDYQRNGSFDEETVDKDLDSLQMQAQQLAATVTRAFKPPVEVTADQALTSYQWASRASQFLGFDASGNFGVFQPVNAVVSPFMETVLDDTTALDALWTFGMPTYTPQQFMTDAERADVKAGTAAVDVSDAVQAAVDAWLANDQPAQLHVSGRLKITKAIVAKPPIGLNLTKVKRLNAYGAEFVNSSADYAWKFSVDGTAHLWRNFVVQGLRINGGVNGILIDGGNPASAEYLYNYAFRDCVIEAFTGDGWVTQHNAFEAQYYNCRALADAANVTGFGFLFDNGTYGTVSSIELYSPKTSYGLNGIRVLAPVQNVNIFGGTVLSAWEWGIYYTNASGITISGVHVEMNYQSNPGSLDQAGIYVSGTGLISGCYGTCSDGKQKYTVRTFAGGMLTIINCAAGGSSTKGAYIAGGSAGVSNTTVINTTYDRVFGASIEEHSSSGAVINRFVMRDVSSAYAAAVTPNLDTGSFFKWGACTGDITVNNPTIAQGVLALGTIIGIRLQQDGTGNRKVTWGAQFLNMQPFNPAPGATTFWLFRWNAANWEQIAYSTSAGVPVRQVATGVAETVGAQNRGTLFTNEGAAARQDFNLPTAAQGVGPYQFVVQNANGVRVIAGAGDTIRIAGNVSAAAGRIDSTTVGDSVTLVAINATEWIATSVVNSAGWTVT